MSSRLHGLALLLGCLPAIAAPNTGIIHVTNIRSWSHPNSTRVIIQTTGPFLYKTDKVHDPGRILVDILNARPLIGGKRDVVHKVNDRIVKRVRVAALTPRITQLAFDLAAPAELTITRLDTPNRMVVELRPVTKAPVVRETLPPPAYVSSMKRSEKPVFISPASTSKRRRQISMPQPPVIASAILADYPAVLSMSASRSFAYLPPPRVLLSNVVHGSVAAKPEAPAHSPVIDAPVDPPLVVKAVVPPHPPVISAAPLASENGSRSLTRALGLKVNRIVIDAGHGGHDDGTIGANGVLEKDVVLDVALRLSKLIQERMGAEVVLTRSDDTFIPLQGRTAIANQRKADLFISIHANSSPSPEVAGTETFFLNFTTSASALDVAARENAGADKNVGELKDLIRTITLNDKIEESHTLAQDVQTSLQAQAARTNPNAHDRGVKRAPFVVLIGASMPSVLAEIGFVSNARDENNLKKPEYRQKISEALYKGIAKYSQSLSHFEMAKQSGREEKPATAGLEQ